MHVPHHGLRTGLSQGVLEDLAPQLAVVTVGKNSYGHPAPQTLTLLQEAGAKTFRTDRYGDIEVVSDGKRFWVAGD